MMLNFLPALAPKKSAIKRRTVLSFLGVFLLLFLCFSILCFSYKIKALAAELESLREKSAFLKKKLQLYRDLESTYKDRRARVLVGAALQRENLAFLKFLMHLERNLPNSIGLSALQKQEELIYIEGESSVSPDLEIWIAKMTQESWHLNEKGLTIKQILTDRGRAAWQFQLVLRCSLRDKSEKRTESAL